MSTNPSVDVETSQWPSAVLVQTAIGDYRQAVLTTVASELGSRLRVFAGREYFDPAVKTRITLPDGMLTYVQNSFLFKRRVLFQRGVLLPAVQSDAAILELNPRILSVWLTLLARRARGKRSIVWGHATSRKGRQPFSAFLRRTLWRLGGIALVYTEHERQLVLNEFRRHPVQVIVAPNSLYRREMMGFDSAPTARGFVCVGRLSSDKAPDLVLDAFILAAPKLGDDALLTFVGDGPLRPALEERARSSVPGLVMFRGHVGDPEILRGIFSQSLATVSPGYVGLSIIQSLSFGTPMIYAADAPHAPEIEAAKEGQTAVSFAENSRESLAAALLAMSQSRQIWLEKRNSLVEFVRDRYSVEAMAEGILTAVAACVRP